SIETGIGSGKSMLSIVLSTVFSSSVLIDFRNSNDLPIISLTLRVVFLLFQRSLTLLNYSYL
ncbi:MAG: hypothetical protein CMG27_00420, partial [Candidatus Marinimicrobia bacterium]|nr:hypothetical protein [Candidatus Neomarinimicrobiota bacterium]